MHLSQNAWQQLRPLFQMGMALEFDYHGRHRFGRLDTVGEGPNGAFLTLQFPDGTYKNFSLSKVENLTVHGSI